MTSVRPLRPEPPKELSSLHGRAMDNLAFIRDTMEAAGSFTAVSGWGMVAVGVVAIIVAIVASMQQSVTTALNIWLAAAVLSPAIAMWAMVRKARSAKMPLLSGPGRKFVLSFSPPMIVGALLTLVLYQAGFVAADPRRLAPSIWNGSRGRWSVLREDRPRNGTLLHGSGSSCAVRADVVESRDTGRSIRWTSHRIRNSNREELRWLSTGRRGMTPARRIQ